MDEQALRFAGLIEVEIADSLGPSERAVQFQQLVRWLRAGGVVGGNPTCAWKHEMLAHDVNVQRVRHD